MERGEKEEAKVRKPALCSWSTIRLRTNVKRVQAQSERYVLMIARWRASSGVAIAALNEGQKIQRNTAHVKTFQLKSFLRKPFEAFT